MQVTASKVGLLLHCARPFHARTPDPVREPTEAMLYGSCVHELLDRIIKNVATPSDVEVCEKWGIEAPGDMRGAVRHARVAHACLLAWCRGGNPFQRRFEIVASEVPQATRITHADGGATSRTCLFDSATHTYDLREGEFAGTFDVLLESVATAEHPHSLSVVVDLKTGDYGDWTRPGELPQMRTLVAQTRVNKAYNSSRWAAAILHSQRGLPPVMYASDEITREDSRAHLANVHKAASRINDGSLTPGDWCLRCPSREGCPANDGALLARSGALVKMSTKELMREAVDPGQLHVFLQQFETLAKRAREALRTAVAGGALIVRPDGKTLVLREKTTETLSKASIVRTLGKERGEELIEELRKRGVCETSTHLELRAVDGDK